MFTFKVSAKTEDIRDTGSNASILRNGVHPVTLQFASVVETKNKALQLNLNVLSGGKSFVLYGPIIQNTTGAANSIGMSLVHKLSIIAGLSEGENISTEEQTVPVGKDNTPTELNIIPQFSDLDCFIHIQEEYSRYNNEIRENFRIRNVFNDKGASADEIIRDSEDDMGKQMAITVEKFVENVTYSDGVTAEEVAEWKAKQMASAKGGAPTPSATVTKRANVFGQR